MPKKANSRRPRTPRRDGIATSPVCATCKLETEPSTGRPTGPKVTPYHIVVGECPRCASQQKRRVGSRRAPGFESCRRFLDPPLSFRTAGFPQYGCKAGFPSGAFPGRRRLKLAPGILRPTSGLHPPFVRLVVGAVIPHCVGPQTRLHTAREGY